MKKLNLTATINLKANAAGKPRRFAILAYSGGLLPVEGFQHPVICDLAGLETPTAIPILIDHTKSVEATLGITDTITNDGLTLTIGGPVTGISATARQVIAQAEAGHTWQASIGASVIDCEDIAAGQSVTVNGQTFTGPVIVARRSVLRETSVLPMGADATTSVNLAAKAASLLKGASMPTVEEWLTSLGVDPASLSPEDMAAMQLAYESKQAPPVAAAPAVVPPVAAPVVAPTASAGVKTLDLTAQAHHEIAASRKLRADEARRQDEIEKVSAGYGDIKATAFEKGWSVEKVELEVHKRKHLQASTRATSFGHGDRKVSEEQLPMVLEAALCMSRNHKNIEKSFTPEILTAAQSQYRGRVGLQQVLIQAAAANGMYLNHGEKIHQGNLKEILAHSCGTNGQFIRAGHFSTASIPGILQNLANKEIMQGWEEEENNWREIANIKSVSDFKTVTTYRLLDNMEYEEVDATGHIAHGVIGEESYSRSADTFAKMFALTRKMIINDDLGAFDVIRERLGRGSSRRLNRLVWTKFLAAPTTFWTTARTNYIEGSTTNLGLDGVGLTAGLLQFRNRKSPLITGQPTTSQMRLGGRPSKVVVPPELESIANTLYAAQNITAVKTSDANIHANKYRPVVAPELSDSSFGGGFSATAWYLFDETMKPVDVSFLNGQQTPTVDSADADFDQLGIQFRGYHDFGADQGEYLAGIKSKGAA